VSFDNVDPGKPRRPKEKAAKPWQTGLNERWERVTLNMVRVSPNPCTETMLEKSPFVDDWRGIFLPQADSKFIQTTKANSDTGTTGVQKVLQHPFLISMCDMMY